MRIKTNLIAVKEMTNISPIRIRLAKEVPTQSENDHSKCLVEHCFIKWSIENFSSFPRKEDKCAISPTFILNGSRWYLPLYPTAKILGINHIVINLFRHKTDKGPRTVTVSYRVGLESGGNKVWFNSNEGFIFGKGDGYGMQTSVFGHLEDFLVEGARKNDTLSVLCEMYVSYIKPSESETPKYAMDLNILSTDLCQILYSKRCTDVLVETPNFCMKAHKSVLCARSRTLAKMLENGNSYIRFSCMSKPCLICLLLYIYSGKLDFLAKNAVFGIGLYEYAYKLSLTGLVNLLAPSKIELNTRVTVEELEATWSICDFNLKEMFRKDFIHSPEFYSPDCTDFSIKYSIRTWPLSTDYISIDTEMSGITGASDISMKMSLLNKDSQPKNPVEVNSFQESNVVFTNSIFPVKDILSCIYDDTLVVSCVCKRYSLKYMMDASTSLHCSFKGEDTWIKELSDNLKNLYKTGNLSDVTLKAGEKEFKLHRSILSARSRIFCRKFLYDQYKRQTLEISDVEPLILELMVNYMYCGKISKSTDIHYTDVMSLYEAAGKYCMGCLKTECARLAASMLNYRNVFYILEIAEQHEDSDLISKCKVYMDNSVNKYFKSSLDPSLNQSLKIERDNTIMDEISTEVSNKTRSKQERKICTMF